MQDKYHTILQEADIVRFTSHQYYNGCLQTRNVFMVDHSARLIAVYNGEPGGTRNTIEYDDTKPDAALNDLIAYTARDDATNLKQYVHAVNCEIATVREEMMNTKRRFQKMDGTVAYHGFQSFAEGEVTPEIAHKIGCLLADELWGDRYQVLVTTHLDTAKYMTAIEENFKKVKDLRTQLEIEKCKQGNTTEPSVEMERILAIFRDCAIGFDEYDDVVIRRLVECIRVMKDKKIVVVLKGGMQAEESVE